MSKLCDNTTSACKRLSLAAGLFKKKFQNCTTRIEARRADSGVGVPGDGAASPSPPARRGGGL